MSKSEVQTSFERIQSIPDDVKCMSCIGWGTNIKNMNGSDRDWLYRGLDECKECAGTGLRPVPKNEMKQ